jgi:hypothetical protein
MAYPSARGRFNVNCMVPIKRFTIATDSIGTFALTLTNVVVGSAIQIEDQAGTTTLYNGTAATSSPLINLSAYAGGSSLNNLRIKVRKGTGSPYYQPWETLATAFVGSSSIYVAQIPDE